MTMNRPAPFEFTALLLGASLLSACATDAPPKLQAHAPTPLDQYPLQAESRTDALHFKIHPKSGLSDNQRRALDQVARKASWNGGEALDMTILTANTPDALRAGAAIRAYLNDHQVSVHAVSQTTAEGQPADVVSLITREYRAVVNDCNLEWENLAATRHNAAPQNLGCAINANLAAQIDDPRDIAAPQPATPGDAGRRTVIIDKYRKGEVTSAARDDAAKGNVSQVIK
ncbi:CpaD family pilus assembly protein [Asticcacaulis excentricus]|uniref:Pilus (Caulobacter type) biogenesis lipoprotein CpaD n=1 Tax=Asticcacaulis excentricus (strain ATCC 15261 / DSM 4724 / KCTC 12464 / NCIMB 9791 / VKM B-1370 / CB 48) TaxID=573065 RepID=E8RQ60_ASTEC|nr:pilus assembly protein CpaD [Asticcacaulis excentricus]ADU12117.1 pilus (Caulobacter type) biogenesis lipoprotein CpaD [Asticcacaulis excentricus CB 48]